MADENSTGPVLPPEPWYKSEVQVRAVVAIGSQGVSLIFRTLPLLGIEITVDQAQLDAIFANVMQGVAVLFGYLAITKRASSPIQPLTLTKASAAAKSETSQLDPNTMTKRES